MAQRVVTNLIDDLDGGPADESLTFGLDGAEYEIDLTDAHADDLRTVLAPFIAVARRVGGRKLRGVRPTGNGSTNGNSRSVGQRLAAREITLVDPSPATVRAWAGVNGYDVSDRGRIPFHVVEAFKAANK